MRDIYETIKAWDFYYDACFRELDNESEKKFGIRYTEAHKWRIIRDISLLPRMDSRNRILEIGPSIASPILKKLSGATVEALCADDLNRNFCDPLHIPLHLCDISRDEPRLPKEGYDCILFCQVLEHFLLSPQHAIRVIMSLVKSRGWILFASPNFASIQKRILLLRGANPQEQLSSSVPYYAHIREPVWAEARRWWMDAGAKIVKEGFTNYNEKEPDGFFSKLFWTARFLKIANWYGLCQVWFPHTREYFYFLIRK